MERRAKVTQIGGPPSEFFVACWREGGIFLVIRLQYFDEHNSYEKSLCHYVYVSAFRNGGVLTKLSLTINLHLGVIRYITLSKADV